MKLIITIFAASMLFLSCGPEKTDSVKEAHDKNLNSSIDENISKFMTEATDARMMNIEQGRLALQKGTNDLIKNYGEKMISDNTRLLKEIRTLAAAKNITLPATLSNEKADGLEDLRSSEGKDFDKKFINMMTRDHRRDVDQFEDAADFKDQDISGFATRNLSVIELHLTSIQQVEESTERITEGVDGN
jgi:putative membrane protein